MKPSQNNTPSAPLTTSSDIIRWYASLQKWHARLAPYFARPEPYERALLFVQGILSEIPRKNGWQLAEQAREKTPYGMQRLLSDAVWDQDGVRDEIRAFALQTLGNKPAVVAIDDTGFLKQGKHSAGVGKQYYGPTGDVRNCQSGAFLSLVTEEGHILIDRELYLLAEWTDNPERCRRAGIPETVPFRTKPELAILMLERLKVAQVLIEWVVADSAYGGNPGLRAWLETQIQPYVMGIACDEPVVLEIPSVGVRRLEVRDVPAYLSASDWQRLSMSEGTKGPRLFDWACLPIWHQGGDDGWHSLLIRRTLDKTPLLSFFLVFAAPPTPLQAKVMALGGRWRVEEDYENSKDLGLDHYEVRSYIGWYRHITLVMLTLAFLTSIALAANSSSPPQESADPAPSDPLGFDPSNPLGPDPPDTVDPAPSDPLTSTDTDLCPLSVPEARHLLARLLFPSSSSPPLALSWSLWRRRHQYRARICHTRHRLKAG